MNLQNNPVYFFHYNEGYKINHILTVVLKNDQYTRTDFQYSNPHIINFCQIKLLLHIVVIYYTGSQKDGPQNQKWI